MNAQNLDFCGMTDTSSTTAGLQEIDHCFTIADIQQSCTKLWLKVNVHFFLDDQCEGTLDPLGNEYILNRRPDYA